MNNDRTKPNQFMWILWFDDYSYSIRRHATSWENQYRNIFYTQCFPQSIRISNGIIIKISAEDILLDA